jgi:hypothetical protein
MRNFFFCSILIFACISTIAQEANLKGTVILAEADAPVVGVVISVQVGDEDNVLAYGITDENGHFSISLSEFHDNLFLTISSMMTETVTVPVVPSDEAIVIRVKEKKLTLRESRIQAPKVTMRGDTLNYNVSSYANSEDRSIGEVLKRIPGVKVTSNGEIFYQNLQISRFYVEGLDLLQGRYGLASKNIDPSMVSTIQVLENHQPIKVLEDTEIPAQAAINLKLKKSALGAVFLTAQAGLGLSPLLYSNEMLGMRFTQSQQNLLMYKNDNTGHDIASEMTSFYGTSSSRQLSFFSPEVLTSPSISSQHYLFNNAHLFSANDLRLLKNGLSLTGNLHFLMDDQKKTGSYRQEVIDPFGENILVAEDLSSSFLKRELAGTMTVERNERDHYLTNRTDANIAWNRQNCTIAADSPLTQSAKLPSLSIENQFTYKTATDRWSSHLIYSYQDDALKVTPVIPGAPGDLNGTATQQVRYGQFNADVQYHRDIHLSRYLSLELNARPSIKLKDLSTGFLSGDAGTLITVDSLSNDMTRTELGLYLGGGLRYRKRSLTAFINTSGQQLYVERNDKTLSRRYGQQLFLLSPTGYAEYKRRNFTYRMDASYRQSISDIRNDLTGYLMSSYRSFSRTAGVAPRSGRFSTDIGIHYKDVRTSFFGSLMAGYVLTHRNSLTSLIYDGIVCQATEISHRNLSENKWFSIEVGTDIRPISSTLKMDAKISHGNSVTLYQGKAVDYVMDALQLSPSWFTFISSYASLSYEANYRLGRSSISGQENRPLHDYRQSVEVAISPFRNTSIKVSCDHYYNSCLTSDKSRYFAKAGLSYKHKKTEWIIDWSNILNTKEIVSYYYDDMSSYCSRYNLRPMEVLLKVRISLL